MSFRRSSARRALLDSAASLLAEKPAASFVEIAAAAGVGRATLYRHFAGREEIIRALTLEVIEVTDTIMARAARTASSAMENLCLILEGLVALGDRYHVLVRVAELVSAPVDAEMSRQNAEFAVLAQKAQEEGDIDPAYPPYWVVEMLNAILFAAWTVRGTANIGEEETIRLSVDSWKKAVGVRCRPGE